MYLKFGNVLKYILVLLKMYLSTKYIDPIPDNLTACFSPHFLKVKLQRICTTNLHKNSKKTSSC